MKQVPMRNEVAKICKIQCQILALDLLLRDAPIAYTGNDICRMEQDMANISKKDSLVQDINSFVCSFSEDDSHVLMGIMQDPVLLKTDYLFTVEEQREAIKEVIGKDLSIEELYDKLGN